MCSHLDFDPLWNGTNLSPVAFPPLSAANKEFVMGAEEDSPTAAPSPTLNPHPAQLAAEIQSQWSWVNSVYATAPTLHDKVTDVRTQVQSKAEAALNLRQQADLAVSSLTTPPQQFVDIKPAMLDFRRLQAVLGRRHCYRFHGACCVCWPQQAGEGTSRPPHLVVGGGTTAVLFNPELVFAVSKTSARAAERVKGSMIEGRQ